MESSPEGLMMITNDQHKAGALSASTDQIGKVFVVVRGMRRCLICERVFTPTRAIRHAENPCYLKLRIVTIS